MSSMAKGYTTPEDVQSQLGRTLTEPQTTYLLERVIPAVEEWIDTVGGRAYGEGAVMAEALVMNGQYAWLSKTPVLSVQAVRGYLFGQSLSNLYALGADRYFLIDGNSGYIRIPTWRDWAYLEVDYTPDPTIPNSIKLAAAIASGVFMRTVLHPQTEWQTEYASAQDVRIKFRDADMPQLVYDLIGSHGDAFAIA